MNNKERVNKATTILFENTPADRILETYEAKDFVEFICVAGGDPLCYRVYDNGKIYEK